MEIKLKIEEILKYTQPTKFIASEIIEKGNVPVLTANKSFVIGYTNEEENIFSNVPCIIFDDFTCDMKYVDFPFKIRSSAIKILNLINNENNIKYIYELIKKIKFDNIDHKRYWISEFSKQQISLIDINKQKMIGEFLSNIDRKIELINKEIYLNNELINVIDFFLNSKKLNVKNDTLSNNIKIQNGYAFNKNDLSERAKIGNNIIKISNIQNGIVKNDNDILFSNKNKENLEKYIVKKNDILIALSGATAGKVGIYNSIEFSYLNQRLAKLIPINLSKNFLSYLIFSRNFEKYVKSLYANSAQPNIKAEDILKFGFTLLSKNLQNSIGEFFFIFKKRIHLLEIKMKMELEYKKKMLKYLFDK